MTVVRQIADALAAKITAENFSGVEQVHGRMNLDPTPVSIDIYPADPFGSDDERGFGLPEGGYVFVVRARAGYTDEEAQQDALLDLCDWHEGLAAALEAQQTLDGLSSSVVVSGPSGWRPYRGSGDQVMIGCEWQVKVIPETS